MPPRPGQSGRHAIAAAGHCPDLCDRMEDGAVLVLSAVVSWACFTFSVSRMGRLVIYYTPYTHRHRDGSVRCGKFCAKGSFLLDESVF